MGVQHIPGCCWVQYCRMADQTAEKMAELSIGEVYTSDKNGSDESGDGTESKPYKTALFSMHKHGKEPFPTIMVDAKEDGKKYEPIAKSQLKKLTNLWKSECKKKEAKIKKRKMLKREQRHWKKLERSKLLKIQVYQPQ